MAKPGLEEGPVRPYGEQGPQGTRKRRRENYDEAETEQNTRAKRRLRRPKSYENDTPLVGVCASCGIKEYAYLLEMDHPLALGLGGRDGDRQPLCPKCHRIKSCFEKRVCFPWKRRLKQMLAPLRRYHTYQIPGDDEILRFIFGLQFDIDAARQHLEKNAPPLHTPTAPKDTGHVTGTKTSEEERVEPEEERGEPEEPREPGPEMHDTTEATGNNHTVEKEAATADMAQYSSMRIDTSVTLCVEECVEEREIGSPDADGFDTGGFDTPPSIPAGSPSIPAGEIEAATPTEDREVDETNEGEASDQENDEQQQSRNEWEDRRRVSKRRANLLGGWKRHETKALIRFARLRETDTQYNGKDICWDSRPSDLHKKTAIQCKAAWQVAKQLMERESSM